MPRTILIRIAILTTTRRQAKPFVPTTICRCSPERRQLQTTLCRCRIIMDKARLFGATEASATIRLLRLLRHRSRCTGEIATAFVWRAGLGYSRSRTHPHRTLSHRLLSEVLQKELANLPQPHQGERHLKELAADTSTHLPRVTLRETVSRRRGVSRRVRVLKPRRRALPARRNPTDIS